MRQIARRRNPLLMPFLMLLASALMFCEPGRSLDPVVNNPDPAGKVPAILELDVPAQVLPGDTVLVRVSVVDSVDSLPLTGADLAVTSSTFSLLNASSTGAFALDSVPADGQVAFRATSSSSGPGTVSVRVKSGDFVRTRTLRVSVTERPVAPHIVGVFPGSLKSGDTTSLSFTVMDSAGTTALANAVVSLTASNLTVHKADSRDFLSQDTTGADGKITLRVVPTGSGTASLTVLIRSAAGITRSRPIPFTVEDNAGADRSRRLIFTALRATLRADGFDSTELRVLVKDDKNNPLPGETIKFASTGGVVGTSATTDEWGRASTKLISERANKTVVVTATLEKTGATAQQVVAFDGVNIAIAPDKKVLMQNTVNHVVFELRDGGNVPMSGDSLEIAVSGALRGFDKKGPASGPDTQIVVTDTKGQYRTTIVCENACSVILSARALGARTTETVEFTNKTLTLSTNKSSLVGNGADVAAVTAHLTNGTGGNMSGVELRWTTTFGNFTSTPFTTTGGDGKSTMSLRAPYGSGLAVVNVEAYEVSGDNRKLVASGNLTIPVRPLKVARMAFKVTPDNIPVKVGEAKMTALAYDSAGNVMSGILVGFKMIKGAGGGDEVISPPVAYTKSGSAEGVLKAGGIISQYRGVQLAAVALDIVGSDTTVIATSDTVGLTVSGPPHKVSVGVNIEKGLNPEDGTFGLPTAAVVTDVNGNLVADGVPVNFSTTPLAAIVTYVTWVRTGASPWYDTMTTYMELPWTDYNNNLRLDPGERASAFNPNRPARGEDRDGDGVIRQAPDRFNDVNGNGILDSYPVEPTIIGVNSTGVRETTFVDLNFNGVQDTVERMTFDSNSDNVCQCAGTLDASGRLYESTYFDSEATHPYPGEASVGIQREVPTVNGKATTAIWYVQSMATTVKLRITAESNGVRSAVETILPIVKSDE